MKHLTTTRSALICATLASCLSSCDSLLLPEENGEIQISFLEEMFIQTKAASAEIPDTNDFILNVTNSKGTVLYNGKYGAAPQTIMASAGTYHINAYSREFKVPAFSAPQFGDAQSLTLKSGEKASVALLCRQMNSGIRLNVSPDFLTAFPNGTLSLRATNGKLNYSYSEKRFAFFNPGQVSLVLSEGSTDKVLVKRDLAARDMLTLNISVASSVMKQAAENITIKVDSTRNWINGSYTIGGDNSKGTGPENAMSVSEAAGKAGSEGVWVYGYIAGGDLSSSKASFSAPFSSRTNIVLSQKFPVSDRNGCMSVQLEKGEIRDALNLVDNPSILGRRVFIKGDIVESYYGLPGIQRITDFSL